MQSCARTSSQRVEVGMHKRQALANATLRAPLDSFLNVRMPFGALPHKTLAKRSAGDLLGRKLIQV